MSEPKIVLNGARVTSLLVRAPNAVELSLVQARVFVATPAGDAEWVFEATLTFEGVTALDVASAGGALLGDADTIGDGALVLVGGEAEVMVETGAALGIERAELHLSPSGARLAVRATGATVKLGRGHRVSEAPLAMPAPASPR